MVKLPRDLDSLRAVIEADPNAWDWRYVDLWNSTDAYPDFEENWPLVPRTALNKVANVDFLEARDREFAEQHPAVPVADLMEALRHFRILDKFHSPDDLFWDQVFNTARTQSALDIFYEACEADLETLTDEHFLRTLIYRKEDQEFLIEGNTYLIGYWRLSLPWSVVNSGIVPPALRHFGKLLDHDSLHPGADNAYRRNSLELDIHGCPTSNPWLLTQTHEFLMGIADKWGWYTALDTQFADLYAFYAACVDPTRVDGAGYQRSPLELAAAQTARLGLSLRRLHDDKDERPEKLAQRFEDALSEEMEVPSAEAE